MTPSTMRTFIFLVTAATALACGSDRTAGPSQADLFDEPVDYPSAPATSVVAGDITGDGQPDLLLVDRTAHQVQILRALGNGRFDAPRVIAAGTDPIRAVAGDVDGNDIPDLIVIGHFDNAFTVRRGLGGGELSGAVSYPLRNHGRQLAVADIDGDGFDDVIAVHDGSGQPIYVSVYRGAASGALARSWENGTTYPVSRNIAVADFNGDGRADFAVGAASDQASLLMFTGLGNATFSAPAVYPPLTDIAGASDGTVRIAASDLNGDGRADIAAVHDDPRSMLSIRLNSGTGLGSATLLDLPAPSDIAVADIDRDGKIDVVIAHAEAGMISIYRGSANGTLEAPETILLGGQPAGLAIADLNGDDSLDIVVTDLTQGRVRVLLNRRRYII